MLDPLDKVQAGDIYLNLIIYNYKRWVCHDFLGKRPKKWWFWFAFTISDFQESERLCNSSGRFNSMEGDSGISFLHPVPESLVKNRLSLRRDWEVMNRGKIGLGWGEERGDRRGKFYFFLFSLTRRQLSKLPYRIEWKLLITSSESNNRVGGSEHQRWPMGEKGDIYLEFSFASLLPVNFYSVTTSSFSVMELIETMKKVIEPSI